MELTSGIEQYTVKLVNGRSEDWEKIPGLSEEAIEVLDEYVMNNYPLSLAGLKFIKKILEEHIEKSEESLFGVRIEYQNEEEGEITIVQMSIKNQEVLIQKNPKLLVWEKVTREGLESEHPGDFDKLVRDNLDRIEFVKDGIGLRDFLFLATRTAANTEIGAFVDPVFATLNTDVDLHDDFKTGEKKYLESIERDESKILNELEDFFQNTKRTLFIGVGFKENLQGLDDLNNIVRFGIEATERGISIEEVMRDKRKFPLWYEKNSRLPADVRFVPKNAEKYLKEFLETNELETIKEMLKKTNQEELLKMIEQI